MIVIKKLNNGGINYVREKKILKLAIAGLTVLSMD